MDVILSFIYVICVITGFLSLFPLTMALQHKANKLFEELNRKDKAPY